jgi:hypothetical protein
MTSKFKGILNRANESEDEPVAEPLAAVTEPQAKVTPPPSPAPSRATPSKKRGRPSGKRTDPDYVQMTAYIHKDTHRDVKISLLKSGSALDFSELVDDLLAKWLKTNR